MSVIEYGYPSNENKEGAVHVNAEKRARRVGQQYLKMTFCGFEKMYLDKGKKMKR